MKQVMLAVGISILFLTACKKENPAIIPPEQTPAPIYEFPTKQGSYWVYDWSIVDSNGVETSLNIVDSVFILGDTLINGNTYTIHKGQYFGGNYSTYFQRDSIGYIVSNHGNVVFTYVDFNTPIASGPYGSWDYYTRVLEDEATITVPVGTFQALVLEYYIYSPNGMAINNCGDIDYSYKTYMVSGIGQVYREEPSYTEFQSQCKKQVRRLVDYYIP